MNTKLMRALEQISDSLRRHKAEIHFAMNCHKLSENREFTEIMYSVHISKNAYHDINAIIGTQIKQITEKELSLEFIEQETMGTQMPPKEVLAFLADLRSVFKSFNLCWGGHAPFALKMDGVPQINIGYYMKYQDLIAARARLMDSVDKAKPALFVLAEVLKRYDASISWRGDIWPGGGHGESAHPTSFTWTVYHVGEAEHKIMGDRLSHENLTKYDWNHAPRPFKSFFAALNAVLCKHELSIIEHHNSIYIEDVCVDSVLEITPYYLYELAQHIDN